MEKKTGFGIGGSGLGLLFAAVLMISPLSLAGSPPLEGAGLAITVRVYNYARVKPAILAEAQKEATRIFAAAAIKATWLDCPLEPAEFSTHPACHQAMGGTDIVLRIIPRSMAERLPFDHSKVGFAFVSKEGPGGTLAVVFYHRVQQFARGEESAESLAIGRAAVHEIGHLLLRTEVHSPRGIMRGEWKPSDFRNPTAILEFTADQAKALRAEVSERLALIPIPAGETKGQELAAATLR